MQGRRHSVDKVCRKFDEFFFRVIKKRGEKCPRQFRPLTSIHFPNIVSGNTTYCVYLYLWRGGACWVTIMGWVTTFRGVPHVIGSHCTRLDSSSITHVNDILYRAKKVQPSITTGALNLESCLKALGNNTVECRKQKRDCFADDVRCWVVWLQIKTSWLWRTAYFLTVSCTTLGPRFRAYCYIPSVDVMRHV